MSKRSQPAVEDPSPENRRTSGHPARVGALSALILVLVATAALTAISIASGEEDGGASSSPSEQARELLRRGTELNAAHRHRAAAEVLRGGLAETGGLAPERLLARANFQLGIALRESGRSPAARKALNRSRLLGFDAGKVGRQLNLLREG